MQQAYVDLDEAEPKVLDETTPDDTKAQIPPRALSVTKGAIATLCVATAITHALMVLLHVAPANSISKHYDKQIDAWVYPFFEQNWRLFAPVPTSSNARFLARTGSRPGPSGAREVGDWFDISAADKADTKHNFFPSHTSQNMLRLAWNSYLNTHNNKNVPRNDWGVNRAKYFRNIAVQRIAAHSRAPFQAIQLRVITRQIPPPGVPADASKVYVRTLPWWNVTDDGD